MNKYLNALISASIFIGAVLGSFCVMQSVIFALTSSTIIIKFLLNNPDLSFMFDIVTIGNFILGLYAFYRVYRFLNYHIQEFKLFVINFIVEKKTRARVRKQDIEFSKKRSVKK